jgi:Protein of unknown function (DUF3604)
MGHIVRIAVALLALAGCRGEHEGPGTSTPARPPAAQDLAACAASQTAAREQLGSPAPAPKQILFGDLHVHTTFSADAFVRSLPKLQGEGAHPPADACDFARFCSALDFWSINDHAEAISPSTGARPRTPSGSATRPPETPATPTSSPSSAGSGRRSA